MPEDEFVRTRPLGHWSDSRVDITGKTAPEPEPASAPEPDDDADEGS